MRVGSSALQPSQMAALPQALKSGRHTSGRRKVRSFTYTDLISCITTLSDGCLATGSDDCTARIWSPKGEELHVLCGHRDSIVCIIALSDGRIITASWDRTAHIWSPEGKQLHILCGHTDKIKCITALSDGCLATGSSDRTVCIWSPAAASGDSTVGIWSPDLNALFEASLKVDEGDPLFQSPNLALPEHGEVLIDAAEIPIESPKVALLEIECNLLKTPKI